MRTFIKNKENLTSEVKRRFHFDPKTQNNKSKIIVKNKNVTPKASNSDFSSVVEKNQFNDSSWLAKLVNGIQEHVIQPQPEIMKPTEQPETILYPTKKNSSNSIYTIERKGSKKQRKSVFKKAKISIDSIYSENKNVVKKNQTENYSNRSHSHKSKQSCPKKSQQKSIKKSSSGDLKKKNHLKSKSQEDKDEQKNKKYSLNKENNKVYTNNCLEKNSLISYSSIGLEQIQEGVFEIKQPVAIFQGEINSVKKYDSQNKQIKSSKRSKKSLDKVKRNSEQLPDKQNIKKDQPNGTRNSLRGRNKFSYLSQLQTQNKKQESKQVDISNKKDQKQNSLRFNYDIVNMAGQTEEEEPKQLFTSDICENLQEKEGTSFVLNLQLEAEKVNFNNQFLSVMNIQSIHNIIEQQRVSYIKSNQFTLEIPKDKPEKQGRIRRNQMNCKTQCGSHLQSNKQNYQNPNIMRQSPYSKSRQNIGQQINTIKKSARSNIRKQNNLQSKIVKNNSQTKNFDNLQIPNPRYHNNNIQKQSGIYKNTNIIKNSSEFNYKQVFEKLNGNNENSIHQGNCCDRKLNEQQRYQIGVIVSKVKYLGKCYTEQQFITECMKINEGPHSEFRLNNKRNYLQKDMYEKNQLKQVKQGRKRAQNMAGKVIRKVQEQKRQYWTCNEKDYENKNNIDKDKKQNSTRMKRYCYMQPKTENYDLKSNDQISSGERNIIKHKNINKSQDSYRPLFPEYSESKNRTPNKSPYLEMPSMVEQQKRLVKPISHKNETVKNIGDVIQQLNSKIDCYIEDNHLEDTYRQFKLDFVHLRKNMYP